MSMYNMMHGINTAVVFFLLPVLNRHPDGFPRFRDAFLGDHDYPEYEGKLVVLTRAGGGNREEFAEQIAELRAMPTYVADYDESLDNTYASFVFDIPAEWQADVELMQEKKFMEVSAAYIDQLCKVYPKLDADLRANFTNAGWVEKAA